MKHLGFLIFISFAISSACKYFSHNKEKMLNEDFPTVISTDSLKETVFVPTLENHLNENKNVIYCPTFLFAWDELRKTLHVSNLQVDSTDNSLLVINNSRSYINSLSTDEYTAETNVSGSIISIRTFFKKSLPFKTNFQKLDSTILFLNTSVKGLGMKSYDYRVADQVKILYYKNDDTFLIRLQPADSENEIIMGIGLDLKGSFIDILNRVSHLSKKGENESSNKKEMWKYWISDGDAMEIPILKFNISNHDKNIEGKVIANKYEHDTIKVAYQRTALIFDEYGAKVESVDSLTAASSADEVPNSPLPPPSKKLIFDKPFVLLMKKKDSKYPYLAMKIETPELMLKK